MGQIVVLVEKVLDIKLLSNAAVVHKIEPNQKAGCEHVSYLYEWVAFWQKAASPTVDVILAVLRYILRVSIK